MCTQPAEVVARIELASSQSKPLARLDEIRKGEQDTKTFASFPTRMSFVVVIQLAYSYVHLDHLVLDISRCVCKYVCVCVHACACDCCMDFDAMLVIRF